MPEKGNALSRNPNICASCSSMADGIEERVVSESRAVLPGEELKSERTEDVALDKQERKAA
jgi:hypothetical protein